MSLVHEISLATTLAESFQRTNERHGNTDLKEISAGTANYVYAMGDGSRILHLNPDYLPDDAEVQAAIEPHSIPNKGQAIYERLSRIKLPACEDDKIQLALPSEYGTLSHNDTTFGYWIENRLDGFSLAQADEKLTSQEYGQLVEWIASLQRLNTDSSQRQPLREYYEKRWEMFVNLLDENSMITEEGVQDILSYYYQAIAESVGPDEQTSFVHGDLINGNILLNDSDGKRTIGIIDFERSVYYGDPLVDVLKLIHLKHEYIPPHPQYSYIPNLTGDQKLDLVMQFLSVRNSDQDSDDTDRLKTLRSITKRDFLIHLDTILSIMAYRTYCTNSKMGNTDTLKEYLRQYQAEINESGIFDHEQ